jgi:serine/threonine protein kinase
MSTVCKAKRRDTNIALKLVRGGSDHIEPYNMTRLLAEVELLQQLRHPNTVCQHMSGGEVFLVSLQNIVIEDPCIICYI